ncbi:MAG: hypothetical protein ABIT08_04775 [Bacteroidia bacterium]
MKLISPLRNPFINFIRVMTAEKHQLSKSTYIRSLQCLKSLFLYKYHYKLRDPLPAELLVRFDKGHNIGKLAQQLFPGGFEVTADRVYDYAQRISLTRELILKGYETIYEAAFQFEKVLAIADILVKRGGKWFAYEVKSSPAISETYLKDAALQYFVIVNSGLQLEDFSIIHLNQKLEEALVNDPTKIFNEHSVLEYCTTQIDFVKNSIVIAKNILEKKIIPSIEIGDHCLKPYRCDFYNFCHRKEPEPGKLF